MKHLPQLLLTALCISPLTQTFAAQDDFAIYPATATIQAKDFNTYSFMVRNRGNQPLVLKVEPVYLGVNDPTAVTSPFKQDTILNSIDPKLFSLDQIAKLSTNYLVLHPEQSKIVRVSFKLPANAESGTYRLNLNFTPQMPPPSLSPVQASGNQLAFNMNIIVAQTISLYVDKGHPNLSQATITSCQYNPSQNSLNITANNASTWVFSPKLTLSNNNKIAYSDLSTISVMPMSNGQREINDIKIAQPKNLKLSWVNANSSQASTISCTSKG